MSNADRVRIDSHGIMTYFENLQQGQYQIPPFQREVVWDRDVVKRLWESIYNFYPLRSILVWRNEIRLQNHSEIGGHLLHDGSSGDEFQYLIDGQQQTAALLTSMYGGKSKGQDDRDPRLYVDLTAEEPLNMEDGVWRERFLFWDEIDDRGDELLQNVGRKKKYDLGLIVKLEDIAHCSGEVEKRLLDGGLTDYDAPARKQLRRFREVFHNYKFIFIEVRGVAVDEVCKIFEHISHPREPLSMPDINILEKHLIH